MDVYEEIANYNMEIEQLIMPNCDMAFNSCFWDALKSAYPERCISENYQDRMKNVGGSFLIDVLSIFGGKKPVFGEDYSETSEILFNGFVPIGKEQLAKRLIPSYHLKCMNKDLDIVKKLTNFNQDRKIITI